ncbi:protein kinase [Sorangium cellulosum]|uniref:Protein kinase n=1 Tax=Sorangium cellulosum TaxID=56 RepID=A0A4P2QBV1_SORCE|nr:serine/threonine-protein kinase [Sorangium cellulosum]AUX27165.1 protein kinase [Sorangium cellulosum]
MRGLEEIQGLEAGTLIAGKYRVDRLLEKGSMGAVLAATDVEARGLRAIKLLLPATAADPEMARRFLREARIAARLRSEHAVRVYDVGRLESGLPFLVMELLTGRDLRALRKQRGPLPVEEATLYIIQACDALAEAHALGLVHRDVKPANLFLTHTRDGLPCIKVLDFGITKVSEASTLGLGDLRTSTGLMLGTPHYMPPEQMRGQRDVDARADIWALGSLLYVLLTGRYPMHARSVQTVSLVLGGRYVPPLPSKVRRGLTPEIDPVIMRCLERDRDQRFADVAELVQALRPFAPPAAHRLVERIERVLRDRARGSRGGARGGARVAGRGDGGAVATSTSSYPPPSGGGLDVHLLERLRSLPPPSVPPPSSGVPRSIPPPSSVSPPSVPPPSTPVFSSAPPSVPPPSTPVFSSAPPSVPPPSTPVFSSAPPSVPPPSTPVFSSVPPSVPPPSTPVFSSAPPSVPPPSTPMSSPAPASEPGAKRSVTAVPAQPRFEAAMVVEPGSHGALPGSWPRRWLSPSRVGFGVAAAIAVAAVLLVSGAPPPEPPSSAPGAEAPLAGAGSPVPPPVAATASAPPAASSAPSAEPVADAWRGELPEQARPAPQGGAPRAAAAPLLSASGIPPASASPSRGEGTSVSAPPR